MSEYTLQCADPTWIRQYNRMLADKISNEEIDRDGYHVWEKMPDGKVVAKQVGNGDHKIECEEIAAVTVNHYERYHEFLRTMTGRAIPWRLKDKALLKKADRVIELAKNALDEQGYRAGFAEYDLALSMALAYLAAAPKKGWMEYYSKRDPIYLRTVMAKLDQCGLSAVRKYLMKEGGFGLAFAKMDEGHEYTGEGAIKRGVAKCTEKAAVLYALFERGGLKPEFAILTIQQCMEVFGSLFGGKMPMISQQEEFRGHVVAALDIGGRPHYFEFSPEGGMVGEMPYDGKSTRISPRDFYQVTISNFVQVTPADKKRYIDGGLKLGRSLMSHSLRNDRVYISKDDNAMIRDLKDALADNPGSRLSRYLMAGVHARTGSIDKAEAGFRALLPGVPTAYYQLGLLYMQREKWGLAMLHYKLALERDPLKTGLKILDASHQIGNIYFGLGDHINAEKYYRTTLGYNDRLLGVYRNLARSLWMQGRISEAMPVFEKTLSLSLIFGNKDLATQVTSTLMLLSILSGDLLRAHHYLDTLFRMGGINGRLQRDKGPLTEVKAKEALIRELKLLGKSSPWFALVTTALLIKTGDINGATEYYRSIYGSEYCKVASSGDFNVMKGLAGMIGDKNLLVELLDSCHHRKYYVQDHDMFSGRSFMVQAEDGRLHYLIYKLKALWEMGREKEAKTTIEEIFGAFRGITVEKIDNHSVVTQMYEAGMTLPVGILNRYTTEFTEFFTRIAGWYENGGDFAAALHVYTETPVLKAQAQKFRDVITRLQKKVALASQ